jgi:dTDP-4-amino-4,6-dideoxy-D-galactose acyltransferase
MSFCELLQWDSEFFGLTIARIMVHPLTSSIVAQIDYWSNQESVDCLYLLVDSSDAETVYVAESHGFRLVDIRITLEAIVNEQKVGVDPCVRTVEPRDIDLLRTIAANSFRESRFYTDHQFPREKCDELYATWIENSCDGWADAVLVYSPEKTPLGFVSCHLKPDFGQIGLVGVRSDIQGRGVGKKLLTSALHWFGQHERKRVRVVTQGRNIRAQKIYQKSGFVTSEVQLWYHRWYRNCT